MDPAPAPRCSLATVAFSFHGTGRVAAVKGTDPRLIDEAVLEAIHEAYQSGNPISTADRGPNNARPRRSKSCCKGSGTPLDTTKFPRLDPPCHGRQDSPGGMGHAGAETAGSMGPADAASPS